MRAAGRPAGTIGGTPWGEFVDGDDGSEVKSRFRTSLRRVREEQVWRPARSDLEALSALDSNADRKLDANDLRFGELKVWVDANRNGTTEAGELKTLDELKIASISLAAAATGQSVKPGENILLATGSFTLTDGTVRAVGDAALAYKPAGAATGGAVGAALNRMLPNLLDAEAGGLAAALRAGLDDTRLGQGLPAEIDPFEFFAGGASAPAAEEAARHRQDVPEMLAPASDEDSAGHRLALMVQDMAAFGRRQGEGQWQNREAESNRFDYFAA